MNFVNIGAGILVIFTILAGVDMYRHFWGRRRARKAQERMESLQQRFVAAQGVQSDHYVQSGEDQGPVSYRY